MDGDYVSASTCILGYYHSASFGYPRHMDAQSVPKIAYVTAIDVWLVSCQVFVFATLIEFALVYYMHSWEQGQYQLQRMKRASRKAVKSGMTVKDNPWSNGYFHGSRMQGPSQRGRAVLKKLGSG
ncbi:glycine receptor subunit beta-like [Saccoglossus kowalevskii]|uniref:Gamma-aminobutyric acid receptor subunit beta-like n=1 Tax=Saccoglossus kowalevskii TaxID=10224 RepID=A0ABM0MZP2_SACKO|nr:PREDICTED: gamma-aminobutyric acid receptor subunit beta-like [Saccoglossus kowalevskii]